MAKLSEQLAELSARAKRTEDDMATARQEARDKLAARRAQAHADATAAVSKVDHEVRSFGDKVTLDLTAAKAKIDADLASLKSKVAQQKHEHDVKHAAHRADALESDASFAIDYAIAAVEQANLAVLDAIEGRLEAEAIAGA
jgi:hypothetical protein